MNATNKLLLPSLNLADTDRQTSTWRLIHRLFAFSWGYRHRAVVVLGLQLLTVIVTVLGLKVVGLGIDFLRSAFDPTVPPPVWPMGLVPPEAWSPMQVIVVIGLVTLVVGLIQAGLHYLTMVCAARLVQRVIVQLRSDVYNKMQRLSFRFFDANETGSIINRVTGDVQGVRMFLDTVVMQTITLVLSVSVYLAYMLAMHVWLSLACTASTLVLAMICYIYGRAVKPAFKENRRLLDRAVLRLSENVQGVHVVKGFSLQDSQREIFNKSNRTVRDQKLKIFGWQALFMAGSNGLTQINLVVLLGYGGYLVLQEQLALGTGLIVFAGLLGQLSAQVTQLAQITNSVQQSLASAERVFEVLDADPEIQSAPNARRVDTFRGQVEFDSVTFGYGPSEAALKDISFRVEPGQCIAVLGPTGAGKSTLLSLIPRFYDPTFGHVRIDGIDVRDMDVHDLRSKIGLVFQESFLFSNTIAANIAFGNPFATLEQIQAAAEIACAHEFIKDLPDRYMTIIGENGVGLSGGQRQRLAIARALLHQPSILIMDDPTAAIDPETEHEILEAMDNAMQGRTTFLVAHRLSTLRRADLVIVLDKGRLVQRGTHDQLIITKGLYRKAANLQIADEESRRLLAMSPG